MRLVCRSLIALVVVTLAACGDDDESSPQVTAVSPRTLCANLDSTLTLTGTDLDVGKVELGRTSGDAGALPVAASSASGSSTMVSAMFARNTLTPSDQPYDLIVTNKDGGKFIMPAAVTVTPGISLAAIDPAAVWNGADFPTSIFGTGMGGITSITVSQAGGTPTALTGITPVDGNRVDATVPRGLAPGVYDVTATDRDGCTASLPGALTVISELTISVCAIDPVFGYNQTDSDVTITSTMNGLVGGATCGGKTGTFASAPRAWLAVSGTLRSLQNVGFLSAGSLTATVPANLPVGGPYDLLVQNPDGTVGQLAAAFKVVDMPVPEPTAVDPPVIPSNFVSTAATPYKIFGRNFRSPVKVEAYGPGGALITIPNPVVVSPTEIRFDAFNPGSLGLVVGAYVVRVTNTDQNTYGEFTAMAIISASFNITFWTDVTATPLPTAVMRHGAAAGQISLASRFMYLVGGDSGGGTPTRQDATQIATLDKFGNIGSWFAGRNRLPMARTSLQLLSVPAASGRGGYLYAAGGETAAGASGAVTRAKILLPEEAPKPTVRVTLGGTLARGNYYYRVSAVMAATDVVNPMGETLASDELAAHTVPDSKVVIDWPAITGAASYRVYRTATINGVSDTEVLLADNLVANSFTDDGSLPAGTARPLRPGELGVWVAVPALKQARRSPGMALAHNPAGAAFLYVVGGDKAASGTPGAADVLTTYEYAALTEDGKTLADWTPGGTTGAAVMATARTRLQSPVGEHSTSPRVATGTAYVYAVGGWNGSAPAESYQPSTVQADGSLVWGTEVASNNILQGLASIVASNQLFALGGTNMAGIPQKIAKSDIYATPPSFGGLNTNSAAATDPTQAQTIASYAGLVFASAHFYLLGGTTDGSAAISRVWSNVY